MIYVMRYIFKGHVVHQFGTMLDRNWKGETFAPSMAKAKSNLNYQWKKQNNYPRETKVILEGHFTSEMDFLKGVS